MMHRFKMAAATLWVAAVAGHLTQAEVSFRTIIPPCSQVLILGVIEDVDPIGSVVWRPYRFDPGSIVVNPGGALRGDGRPDIVVDPSSCVNLVTWSYATGSGADIALVEIVNGALVGPRFLTWGPQDDRDPRLFVEANGTAHIVWWVPSPTPRVLWMTRPAGSGQWGAPQQVSPATESVRRPSVAVFDGALRVAYERDSNQPSAVQDIVVAVRRPDGGFDPQVVGHSSVAARVDPTLHVENGRFWISWKNDAGSLAYAVWEGGGWSGVRYQSCSDPSWVGVEQGRLAVRSQVLAQ